VFLATLLFALPLQIAPANEMLKSLKWLLPYLWTACAAFLLIAILLGFSSSRDEARKDAIRPAFRKQSLMQHLTDLMLNTRLNEKTVRKTLTQLVAVGEVQQGRDQYGLKVWSSLPEPRSLSHNRG
jgi:hypothetical protein